MPQDIPRVEVMPEQLSSLRLRFWVSIAGTSIGAGLVLSMALAQSNLIAFLGWVLMVAGHSLNIQVQREVAKDLPSRLVGVRRV
jgi:hypothetical protein